MAKGVKLTEGERRRILDLVAEGYSYAETARRTGFGVGTVCRTAQAQPEYAPPDAWTAETIAAPLERLYRSGMSYEAMASRLGISTGHLKRWRRRLGLISRRWETTDEGVAEMVRLREQGLFYREIAQRLGCSADTVWAQLSGRDDLDLRRARARRGELARQWAYRDYGRYGSTHGR
jgi:DNA-directed RNA polymerase specialized sigma24 family protein